MLNQLLITKQPEDSIVLFIFQYWPDKEWQTKSSFVISIFYLRNKLYLYFSIISLLVGYINIGNICACAKW